MSRRGIRNTGLPVLASLFLLLSACTTPSHRPDPVPPEPATETGAGHASSPAQPAAVVVEQVETPEPSPWPRLRNRFVLDSCNYSDAVIAEARRYTRAPGIFSESLRIAMPFLLLVVEELERRDLPGEFAFLPYVESHYRLLPGKARGPAGMWQLMPRTATGQGLLVSKMLDQRLDAILSTRVALDLIERYDREFGDWRLAVMAFNAGEYRVKRQLGNRSAPGLDAKELRQLKLSPITHQHLNRVLAMSCIVERPETFAVDLPAPEDGDFLDYLSLDEPIDIRVAANLLGMPLDSLRQLNAAWRADPARIGPVDNLLVPTTRVAMFDANLGMIPHGQRAAWHEQRIQSGDTLASLAEIGNLDTLALAAANGTDPDADTLANHTILMPGRGADVLPPIHADTHVVRQGDTLSAIAHRYGVRVGQLLRWNNLDRNSILQLDMQLQLRAPQ